MQWFLLLAGILSNAGASILIKVAMTAQPQPKLSEPLSLILNPALVCGLGLYGLAFALYAFALTKLPLNVAHPILTSGAIAVVALASSLLFSEQFGWIKLLGVSLIISGVVVLAME